MTDSLQMIATTGRDPRFGTMCLELDAYLNDLVGGEVQRRDYVQYNTPEAVTDVLLLLDGDQAAGCAGFKRFSADTAEVKRVYTRPAYRRHGHARLLMQRLEELALSKGYSRLILETGRLMTPAIRFYTDIGFTRIENYAQYQGMPESVCFAKPLIPHT